MNNRLTEIDKISVQGTDKRWRRKRQIQLRHSRLLIEQVCVINDFLTQMSNSEIKFVLEGIIWNNIDT
jgi:hypothetical protein